MCVCGLCSHVCVAHTCSWRRGQLSTSVVLPLADKAAIDAAIGDKELSEKLWEDMALLDGLLPELEKSRVEAGEQSPLFYGSAINDFGVDLLLNYFAELGSTPVARAAVKDDDVEGDYQVTANHPEFTAFVFKMQVRATVTPD